MINWPKIWINSINNYYKVMIQTNYNKNSKISSKSNEQPINESLISYFEHILINEHMIYLINEHMIYFFYPNIISIRIFEKTI